jgi:hypothetical protein
MNISSLFERAERIRAGFGHTVGGCNGFAVVTSTGCRLSFHPVAGAYIATVDRLTGETLAEVCGVTTIGETLRAVAEVVDVATLARFQSMLEKEVTL